MPTTEHIIDISESGARLKVAHEQLIVIQGEEKRSSLPLEEVAVLVVSHPAVTYTQAVLSGLMEAGGAFICCDVRRMPNGILLPLAAHHLHGERLQIQLAATAAMKKRAWQQVVQAKVRAQASLLQQLRGDDYGLEALAGRVQSGDPKNIEAQAARRYWTKLFADDTFRRNRDADGANALLNYGYGVLRGVVGRAICTTGLHPALGIHHHNRYDAFCLADDLMEPYRPLVDRAVVRYTTEHGMDAAIDKNSKTALIGPLMDSYAIGDERRSFFDIAHLAAVSLMKVFQGEIKSLVLGNGLY
ncbi:MAG: type II CRISPR-associated endonuclease Cas1 [Candidatus Hydrogenedentes bacterium]|nr:type II CRISPR-associated endonuclease Cas1 [Candidatus Hydrogenedentota bacterium]